MKIPKIIRVVATDIAGVALMVASPFLGGLPGPGGIPVFLAGLGLIAIHHEWAKRLLKTIKDKGMDVIEVVFPSRGYIMVLYDLLTLCLVSIAIYIGLNSPSYLQFTLMGLLFGTSICIFLANRRRYIVIQNIFKRKH